jgi:ribonuclease HI
MEITAVLEGLKYIQSVDKDSSITLYSDSKYILGGVESWMSNWIKNNWLKKDNKPVLNADLWKEIYAISQKIPIKCVHVKGHSGHPENEECDKLAVDQIAANKK